MKISQQQKTENRRAIILAAVELMTVKGIRATTMREVARRAGLGDATIYNYFPTKESILFGYYEDHVGACLEELKALDDFHTFTLQEQLHTLFDTSLTLFLPDREFVAATFGSIWLGGSRDLGRIKTVRAGFLKAILDILGAAEDVGEIPEQVFLDLIGQFFMDAYIAMVLYWLSDRSDTFGDTAQIMNRGLDLACALLKAGIANKMFDMAMFLFKNHVLNRMDFFLNPLQDSGKVKRPFMEAGTDG
jgi:AcrR family transcriptional regulator